MFAEGCGVWRLSDVTTRLVIATKGGVGRRPSISMPTMPKRRCRPGLADAESGRGRAERDPRRLTRRAAQAKGTIKRVTTLAKADGERNLLDVDGQWKDVPLYKLSRRYRPGEHGASGPAIVEDEYFTAFVLGGWDFVISDIGDIFSGKEVLKMKVLMTEYLRIDLDAKRLGSAVFATTSIGPAARNYKEGMLVYDRNPRDVHPPVINPERYEYTFSPDPELDSHPRILLPLLRDSGRGRIRDPRPSAAL